MTIDIKSMGYVRVTSTDPEQWRTFAGKVLGLAEGRGPHPDHQYWRIDEVSARLVVVPGDVDELTCVGWEVADHRALQEVREHLQKAGVDFEDGTLDGFVFMFTIQPEYLMQPETWINGLSQSAWSCSAGMGMAITYSVYMRKDEDTTLNAATEDEAVEVSRSVARSNLFKAAIFGNDPNWGRVLASIGTTDATFDPADLDVAINGVWVCKQSTPHADPATVDLKPREVSVTIDLKSGSERATVWTNDLTHAYVHENSAYSS